MAGTNQDLQSAQQTISLLQQRNDELLRLVNDAKAKPSDPDLDKQVAKLQADNQSLRQQTQTLQSRITETIEKNLPLVERTTAAADPSSSTSERKYYVIALTSASREDIENEIARVKAKVGQEFQADFPNVVAYAPQGGLYTLLVSSRPMSFAEASQLKQKAITAGFNRSTWLWQSDVPYFGEKK